jgi:hypothetical protein
VLGEIWKCTFANDAYCQKGLVVLQLTGEIQRILYTWQLALTSVSSTNLHAD